MLLSRLGPGQRPLAFNHAIHAKEGLECSDCHAGAAESDEPGLPSRPQCMLCHENLDKDKPPERHVVTLFSETKFQAQHAARLDDELIFSHRAHVARGEECASCHRGIDSNVRIGPEIRVTMDDCTACHASKGGSQECAACHREVRKDEKPASHHHNWRRMHGGAVRAGSEEVADRCTLCHNESSCTSCHADSPPENHNGFWRTRGHGIAAEMDRDNCAVCHRPDSCARCHADTTPLSHTGMWGATRDTHCLACHFPLQSNTCAVCHKGTPSHELATPMPPWHNAGMNCRQCHGVTQPLPHVDNRATCTMCHH